MVFNEESGKKVAAYSALLGIMYATFGLLEIIIWAGVTTIAYVPADIFGGIMLLIIASVYLAGVSQQLRGNREGLSFLAVGSLLSAVFFGVYVTIVAANGLGYVLQPLGEAFGDWAEWTWLDDVRPAIWLFFFAIPGAYLSLTKKEWRE